MADLLTDLYEIVNQRKMKKEEGSYTAYLFDAGLDKILKKLGEEVTETIIAAKNFEAVYKGADAPTAEARREDLIGEVGDLLYHLAVMLCDAGIKPDEIDALLRTRMQKTGNLKKSRETDKNS
jgi:phosphoribosyl-ATP pyrophosphohydrolase